MVVAEISGGMVFGSMSLLAEGWHIGRRAAELGVAALADAMTSVLAILARPTASQATAPTAAMINTALRKVARTVDLRHP